MGDLNKNMPVYVTRETADGLTGSLSMSIWMALLAMLLIWVNIIVWGIIGIIMATEWIL